MNFCAPLRFSLTLATLASTLSLASTGAVASEPVRFDVPPIAMAVPHEGTEDAVAMPGQRLVELQIQLSTLVASPSAPAIDQCLVRIDTTDAAVAVADYAPRTELASSLASDIEVQQTDESSQRVGWNVAGAYGHLVRADGGGDLGKKTIENLKFTRLAPLELVAASGTVGRSRGVYFKLRRSASQVIEGDKRFSLILSVPEHWRAGLLEVNVQADSLRRRLPGMSAQPQSIGNARFVVAAFLEGDAEAHRAALAVAESERHLRRIAHEQQRVIRQRAAPTLLHQVAVALDVVEPGIPSDWLERALYSQIDPHTNAQIRRLPVNVRVAVLDYQDARKSIAKLNLAAKRL